MLKGAIFDMDGLLFDTERVYHESWVRGAGLFDQTPDPDFARRMCGVNGELARQVIRDTYPAVDPDDFFTVCMARAHYVFRTEPLTEKTGVHEILDYFKDHGVRIGLTTGGTIDVVRSNLAKAGLTEYFEAIVPGDEVENGKPDPEIFRETARRLSLKPEECYVIEDSPNALRGACKAGCCPVMIPDMLEPDEETRKICAGIYPTLTALLDAVKRGDL